MLGVEVIVELTHAVLFPLLGEVEHASSNSIREELMRGSVTIRGTSNAIVTVDCSESLARRLGAAMFDTDEEELSDEEIEDALGEVANIIGGNIKALLPGPSKLGLPEIDAKVSEDPRGAVVVKQAFECTGEPFRVVFASRQRD